MSDPSAFVGMMPRKGEGSQNDINVLGIEEHLSFGLKLKRGRRLMVGRSYCSNPNDY